MKSATPRRQRRWKLEWVALALLGGCGGSDVGTASVDPPAEPCLPGDTSADMLPGASSAPECGAAQAPLTLAYANVAGGELKLDLYRPPGAKGPWPTVIWIHGGGWISGDRRDADQAKRLVCRGYEVASVDYRLSDAALFPAQIQDVKAAIRFLRANASTYNLDGSHFATFGSSAGGHLAALAATSAGVAALEDLAQGNPTTSSAVQAGIAWYGPTEFSQMDRQLLAQSCAPSSADHSDADSAESKLLGCTVGDATCAAAVAQANPVAYVGANTPPLYLLHGSNDCTVPEAQSELLKAAMDSAGRCAIKRKLVGAGHGGPEWQTAPPQAAVAAFLDAVFNPAVP